ncbi:Uncharacterized protein C12orf56 homolog [Vulpes lagopus]
MAGPARSGFPARTHSRLDAFLRRHLPPEVYDAVRACERCLVGSDAERLSLQYVVLSDRLIYLAESPPRGLRRAAALRDVLAIELVRRGGGLGTTAFGVPVPAVRRREGQEEPPSPAAPLLACRASFTYPRSSSPGTTVACRMHRSPLAPHPPGVLQV